MKGECNMENSKGKSAAVIWALVHNFTVMMLAIGGAAHEATTPEKAMEFARGMEKAATEYAKKLTDALNECIEKHEAAKPVPEEVKE